MTALSFTGNTANFETWYEELSAFTPRSDYFKIEEGGKQVIEARLFDHMCKQDPYHAVMHDRPHVSVQNEDACMAQMIETTNQIIQGRQMFFRTNLFSPKDVDRSCLVSSGEETLELLLQSNRMSLGFKALKDKDLYFVFRDVVSFKEEFRCFVEKGTIKAISQYDDSDTVKQAYGASAIFDFQLEDYMRLYGYVENVIKTVGISEAVIDVGNTDDGFMVIEINPYCELTDKCLLVHEDVYGTNYDHTKIRFWSKENEFTTYHLRDREVLEMETSEVNEPVLDTSSFLANLRGRLVTSESDL